MSPQHDSTAAFAEQYLQHPGEDMSLAEALAQHNANEQLVQDAAGSNGQSATDTASAALAHYSMTVPIPTEQQFLQSAGEGNDRPSDSTFDLDSSNVQDNTGGYSYTLEVPEGGQAATGNAGSPTSGLPKPAVGSDEWHKVRRDNHKEVERRRRETINEGITELAKIVPGCEKNKGQILQRAVQFITQLKENESQNIEKWTLEKLLTEQAITELSSASDKLKTELRKSYEEGAAWKRCAARAGVQPTEEEWEASRNGGGGVGDTRDDGEDNE